MPGSNLIEGYKGNEGREARRDDRKEGHGMIVTFLSRLQDAFDFVQEFFCLRKHMRQLGVRDGRTDPVVAKIAHVLGIEQETVILRVKQARFGKFATKCGNDGAVAGKRQPVSEQERLRRVEYGVVMYVTPRNPGSLGSAAERLRTGWLLPLPSTVQLLLSYRHAFTPHVD